MLPLSTMGSMVLVNIFRLDRLGFAWISLGDGMVELSQMDGMVTLQGFGAIDAT
jgi:hypothetical protein